MIVPIWESFSLKKILSNCSAPGTASGLDETSINEGQFCLYNMQRQGGESGAEMNSDGWMRSGPRCCPAEHRGPGRRETSVRGAQSLCSEQHLEGHIGVQQVERKATSSWAWGTRFLEIQGRERVLGGWEAISACHRVELLCQVQSEACWRRVG